MTRELLHIDCFAGAGGFSAGLRAAGFRTVAAVEQDANAVASFRRNLPEAVVVKKDIRQVSGWDSSSICPRTAAATARPTC